MTNFTHENSNNEQNNTQNEVLGVLLSFREIKPRVLWQEANKGRLLEQIRQTERAERLENRKPSYIVKQMSWFAKPIAISLASFGLFSGAVMGTQAISPLSAMYPAKIFVANAIYKALPKDKQIELRLALANEKLTALKTLSETKSANIRQISYLSNSLTSDLYFSANNVKQITDIKKIAAISPIIKAATNKMSIEKVDPKLQDIVNNTKSEILAVVTEGEDKSNNCPAYLNERINTITDSDKWKVFETARYSTVIELLGDAKKAIENNDCLKALELLDQVEKYQIEVLISPTTSEKK